MRANRRLRTSSRLPRCIEVDDAAGGVLVEEDRIDVTIQGILHRKGDFMQRASRQTPVTLESCCGFQ